MKTPPPKPKPADRTRDSLPAKSLVERVMREIDLSYPKINYVPAPVSLEEGRQLLLHILAKRMDNRRRKPWFSAGQWKIVDGLLKYFLNHADSPYPLHLGLYVWSRRTGTGKTMLMKALGEMAWRLAVRERTYQTGSTKELMTQMAFHKHIKVLGPYRQGNWLLDELGAESLEVRIYGDVIDPMDLLLSFRYDKYIDELTLTHFTSNLHPDLLEDHYGPRTMSRGQEWVTSVHFTGVDKRSKKYMTQPEYLAEEDEMDDPAP